MDNYLAQFIREYQATYPNISKYPVHVMWHLLFVIGNGYEYSMKNGNFTVPISYSKSLPFHVYYSENTTTDYLREVANSSWENEATVEKNAEVRYEFCYTLYNNIGRAFNPDELKDTIWDEEWAKFNSRYDNQVTLPDPAEFNPDDTLYNPVYWIEQIQAAGIELSKQDFSRDAKIGQFNANTDIVLKKTTQAILEASYVTAGRGSHTNIMKRIASLAKSLDMLDGE
jgi:hypothetical protein